MQCVPNAPSRGIILLIDVPTIDPTWQMPELGIVALEPIEYMTKTGESTMNKMQTQISLTTWNQVRGLLWRVFLLASCASVAPLLSGCSANGKETNQSKLCVFSNDAQAKKCKTGELAYFSPDSWGNDQLPLNVIATYCDTNRPIEFNVSGVICTFTDKRLWLLQPSSTPTTK